MGHEAKDCRSQFPARQNQQQPQQQQQGNNRGCFRCGAEGHMRKDCPQLNQNRNNDNRGAGNNNNNNNREAGNNARAFVIGAAEARNDPNVVAET
ncbi:putative transcription factor interactor and regulator CCHC(Zn) family [Helianthus anomalus]